MDVRTVKGERQNAADQPEQQADQLLAGKAGQKVWHDHEGRLFVRVGKDGCIFEVLDPTAGVRAYTGPRGAKRFWVGFYNQKAIDHYTGAPLAIDISSASVPEWKGYLRPDGLYERLKRNLGDTPRSIVGDKGYSLSTVFERHTRDGIATVMPWRRRHWKHKRADDSTRAHDEYGIPRCRHCGGTTRFVRFNPANLSPRLWFKCATAPKPECRKVQTIGCSRNWRMLLPMWRDTDTYLALRDSHTRYERVHHHWRNRYRVGADTHELRPKRRGIACQQLRASAALVIEWLAVLCRDGWFGSARPKTNRPELVDKAKSEPRWRKQARKLTRPAHIPRSGLSPP